MYEALVIAHSWLRWLVLLTALFAFFRAIGGRMSRRDWDRADEAAGWLFVMSLDLQVVIGVVLYLFLSPYTMSAWSNMPEAMRDSSVRFWAVEHLVGMLGGAALAHIGRAKIRKASDPARRHFLAAVFFGLALLVIFASIPWPFMPAARPLYRGF